MSTTVNIEPDIQASPNEKVPPMEPRSEKCNKVQAEIPFDGHLRLYWNSYIWNLHFNSSRHATVLPNPSGHGQVYNIRYHDVSEQSLVTTLATNWFSIPVVPLLKSYFNDPDCAIFWTVQISLTIVLGVWITIQLCGWIGFFMNHVCSILHIRGLQKHFLSSNLHRFVSNRVLILDLPLALHQIVLCDHSNQLCSRARQTTFDTKP